MNPSLVERADRFAATVADTLGGDEARTALDVASRLRTASDGNALGVLALRLRYLADLLGRNQRPYAAKARISALSLARELANESVALKYGRALSRRLSRNGVEVVGQGRLNRRDWLRTQLGCERDVHTYVRQQNVQPFATRDETGTLGDNSNGSQP